MNVIRSQFSLRPGTLALVALVPAVLSPSHASAQELTGRIRVEVFDQLAVSASVEETFGGSYDLGSGIAKLVHERLEELGAEAGVAEGRIEGTIVYFGKESARGEAAGVSVGGVRVGLGRRREVALVLLEARLVDVASGQLVTSVSAEGKSDRGGWDLAASRRRTELGSIDLSGEEFRSTALGEATHQAVDDLSKSLASAADELGTFDAPEPVADEPMPDVDAVPMTGVPMAGAGIGGWVPYQFKGTEHFRYEVTQVEDGEQSNGHYELDLQPAGEGRVRMAVSGLLGDETYSSTVTTALGPEGMQMGMGQIMALGPIGMTLLNPTSWMMLGGHGLNIGDSWSSSSGGESISIAVEQSCSHGGQSGALVVFRENGAVRMESCLSTDVALPLRMLMDDDGSRIELTLSDYRY